MTRQEKIIGRGKRHVPVNQKQLIGDAFKNEGIDVHYSIEDNDDTIASFAYHEDAAILSRDRDFWRYVPLP